MLRTNSPLRLRFISVLILTLLVWCAPGLASGASQIKKLEEKAQWLFELRQDLPTANAAIEAYHEILRLNPDHELAPLRLAKLYIWVGYHMNEDLNYYEKAIAVSKEAVERHPGKPGPVYWLGVSMGLKATAPETGPLTCLSLLEPIEAQMKKLITLDPTYEYGGAYRILGRINTKTPFLLGGDKELAEEYLRKAVKQGPQFYLNHLYLADLLSRRGKREEGLSLLHFVLKAPPMPGLEPETKLWKDTAQEILTQQAKVEGQQIHNER